MKIVMATLVAPTFTSELYEFSLADLSQLFETKAFASKEAAMRWAQEQVDDYDSYLDADDLKHERFEAADTTEANQNVGGFVSFHYWAECGGPEMSVDTAFCLRVWEQEV